MFEVKIINVTTGVSVPLFPCYQAKDHRGRIMDYAKFYMQIVRAKNPQCPVKRIAETMGVSVRSVYRHAPKV